MGLLSLAISRKNEFNLPVECATGGRIRSSGSKTLWRGALAGMDLVAPEPSELQFYSLQTPRTSWHGAEARNGFSVARDLPLVPHHRVADQSRTRTNPRIHCRDGLSQQTFKKLSLPEVRLLLDQIPSSEFWLAAFHDKTNRRIIASFQPPLGRGPSKPYHDFPACAALASARSSHAKMPSEHQNSFRVSIIIVDDEPASRLTIPVYLDPYLWS